MVKTGNDNCDCVEGLIKTLDTFSIRCDLSNLVVVRGNMWHGDTRMVIVSCNKDKVLKKTSWKLTENEWGCTFKLYLTCRVPYLSR